MLKVVILGLALSAGNVLPTMMGSDIASAKPPEEPRSSEVSYIYGPGAANRQFKRLELSEKDFRCAAVAVYFEANNQSVYGQRAVYHVIANRVLDPDFPSDVCSVVKQGRYWKGHPIREKCHFSYFCDGKSDNPRAKKEWKIAQAAVREANRESDYTQGATYYHADYVSPYWKEFYVRTTKIEKHIFYRKE
jgi:N-acetylmuramoyl-L-alanine amidase